MPNNRNYRLTPRPGISRAGRIIKTGVKPVISQMGQVKVNKQNPVKKVIIQKPVKPGTNPGVVKSTPKVGKIRSQPSRSSKMRQKKELEIIKFKKITENLKNVGVGKILIMVACGPSILEVDLPKLKGHPKIDIMSINKPDPRLHPTEYWVFCDQSQYNRNKELFNRYEGTLINAWSIRATHPNQVLIRTQSGNGFSKDLTKGFYVGRSTTFANMQTAYWMNYDKVYIFGCDMAPPDRHPGGNLHFYGRNPDVVPEVRAERFAKEAKFYEIGAKQLNTLERKKFVFCSSYNPWPFVDQFEKMDHKIAVDHILNHANELLQK